MIKVESLTMPADRLVGDAVAALFFEDQRPLDGPVALLDWRLDGQLTRLLLDGELSGRAGEHVLLQNNGKLKADWAMLVGGGKWQGLCRETYIALLNHILATASQAGFRNISICVAPHEDAGADDLTRELSKVVEKGEYAMTACRLSCTSL